MRNSMAWTVAAMALALPQLAFGQAATLDVADSGDTAWILSS
jgi:hypothetical protein